MTTNAEEQVLVSGKGAEKPLRVEGGLAWRLMRLFRTRTPASKSYRYLARQIEADLPAGERSRCIAVGSPASMRMNTESLLMFAYFLQDELGCRVLLVDGTFSAEGVGAALGHSDAPGFLDLLYNGNYALDKAILPTSRRNISLLPAGRPPKDGFLPLRAEHIDPLLGALRERFDYVLIQQGSLLKDTRHLVLAGATDLALLLVEEGVTRVSEMEDCQTLLRDYQIANYRFVISRPN